MSKRIVILMCLFIAEFYVSVNAQQSVPYPDYDEDVLMEWEIDKNIATPVVEKSEKKAVARYMKSMGEWLRDKHFNVELMREGEVVIVSFPTDDLFLPNDTVLTQRGEKIIAPVLEYMQAPYRYKILFTVNTDDSGSSDYLYHLSDARVAAIYGWFMDKIDEGKISEDIVIIPYAMGGSSPIVTNETREGRKKNRRLEIYFVPGPEMVSKAKNKELGKFTN